MAKIMHRGELKDVDALKGIIKKFLDTGSVTVSKGRFPVKLPYWTDRLGRIIEERCESFNKSDGFDIAPALGIELGTIHYRFEDVANAFEEFKTRAILPVELPIVGLGIFRSIEAFSYEVNRALQELWGVYCSFKETGVVGVFDGVWEEDGENDLKIKRELVLVLFEG
jgi:hypothetical protein